MLASHAVQTRAAVIANASSSECKLLFDSVVQEVQHSIVRFSKASSVSADSQS